jgi:hypothetical protein
MIMSDTYPEDLNEAAREADLRYREAERAKAAWPPADVPAPYLITLMFLTDDDAHEVVESIKQHGGIITEAAGMHTKTVHCSIADMRKWGDRPKVYRRTEV